MRNISHDPGNGCSGQGYECEGASLAVTLHHSVFFCSVSGRGILSGHADGTIVRFFFDDEGSGESQVPKILPSEQNSYLHSLLPSSRALEGDQAVERVEVWRGAAGCAC